MLRTLSSVCLLVFAAFPALAQSPWNGTWKLNQARSHMTGDTFTLTKAGGKYHYDGGSVQYDYACDGKDYPTLGPDGTPTTWSTCMIAETGPLSLSWRGTYCSPSSNSFA